MPELGSYGSVRGARGNSRPYREHRRKMAASRISWAVEFLGRGCGALEKNEPQPLEQPGFIAG
jgi:hypothetical protein